MCSAILAEDISGMYRFSIFKMDSFKDVIFIVVDLVKL
jgi:hypothetical protein